MDFLFLKIGTASDGKTCAIAYTKPAADKIVVLDIEIVADEAEANAWFARISVERPWEQRH